MLSPWEPLNRVKREAGDLALSAPRRSPDERVTGRGAGN